MTDQEQNPAQPATPLQLLDTTRPIVIGARKKKKRKYSRGLRDLQVSGRRMTKVSGTVTRAVSKGLRAYRKASDKSARKKRDGAIRDFGLNAAKGASKLLRSSSSVPYDLARAMNRRGLRRSMRRQVRAAARFNRLLGGR
jgi:hypothetical protein